MKKQHFETAEHDLTGYASLDLHDSDFNLFASQLAGYNPDRLEAVALKMFAEKEELIVTVFAVDKFKQEQSNYPADKLPVKKFKVEIKWEQFIKQIKSFDFVVTNEAFDVEDMLVMNK